MSVFGEFDRHLGHCVDLLEASDSDVAYVWATRLLEARGIAKDDLTAAARRVLSFGAAEPSIAAVEFASAAETDGYGVACDALLEISRLIAGVPADYGSGG